MWVHTIYLTMAFNIVGPHCKPQYFYWIENGEHLEDFQHKGRRWVYDKGMTSVSRVAHYFPV